MHKHIYIVHVKVCTTYRTAHLYTPCWREKFSTGSWEDTHELFQWLELKQCIIYQLEIIFIGYDGSPPHGDIGPLEKLVIPVCRHMCLY